MDTPAYGRAAPSIRYIRGYLFSVEIEPIAISFKAIGLVS